MIDANFFLAKDPELLPRLVNVPGVGECYIRKMSQSEYTRKVDLWMNPKGKPDSRRHSLFNLRLVHLCVTDAEGNELFTEDDYETVAANTPLEKISRLANYIAGGEGVDDDLGE